MSSKALQSIYFFAQSELSPSCGLQVECKNKAPTFASVVLFFLTTVNLFYYWWTGYCHQKNVYFLTCWRLVAGWQSLIEISNTKNLLTIAFDVISLKFAWKIHSWVQPIVDYLLKSRETKKKGTAFTLMVNCLHLCATFHNFTSTPGLASLLRQIPNCQQPNWSQWVFHQPVGEYILPHHGQ